MKGLREDMKLITWNTARRKQTVKGQVAYLQSRSPDVVALQEVTKNTSDHLAAALKEVGLPYCESTASDTTAGARGFGVLTASRFPLSKISQQIASPWPERTLSVELAMPGKRAILHNIYVPSKSNGWVKVDVLEAVFETLSMQSAIPQLFCGDFNTPQRERSNEDVVTFAQTISKTGEVRDRKTILGQPALRWHEAERNMLIGLEKLGMYDVFRKYAGYDVEDWSWVWNSKSRYRLDHILASEALRVVDCKYLHDVDKDKLSDHSPLEAVFEI